MTIGKCTNMDWALEELLQDNTQHNDGTTSNPELLKEDYIEVLHQLLEHEASNSECSKVQPPTATLPPPLTLPAEQPRLQEVEDLPPLSPPEGYRDPERSKDEHQSSMTARTCPRDKQGMSATFTYMCSDF